MKDLSNIDGKPVCLVLACDRNFRVGLVTSFLSFFKRLEDKSSLGVLILNDRQDDFSEWEKNRFREICSQYSVPIAFKCFPESEYGFAGYLDGHITRATFLRLWAPSLFDSNIEKRMIYLDSDTFTVDSPDEVLTIPVQDGELHSVRDPCDFLFQSPSDPTPFMCAGFFVVKLGPQTRDHFKKILSLLESKKANNDQDGLNLAFGNSRYALHPKFNLIMLGDRAIFPPSEISERKAEAISHPVIFHYAGKLKPWGKYFYHKAIEDFFDVVYEFYAEKAEIDRPQGVLWRFLCRELSRLRNKRHELLWVRKNPSSTIFDSLKKIVVLVLRFPHFPLLTYLYKKNQSAVRLKV